MVAVTPLPPSASAGESSAWFPRRKETLERLRGARSHPDLQEISDELGLEALRVFQERPDAITEVRRALLDVGGHLCPERTRPILVELITTFGEDPGLRVEACRVLADTSPQTACDVLGDILREERPRTTYPPTERMLDAWIRAARTLEIDQADFLSTIAVDLQKDNSTRTLAVKTLGTIKSPIGRQALESVLVESTGNHYLRRKAAQSLLVTIPRDEFCALIRQVFSRESDQHFQQFLADVLEDNCQ